MPNPPKPARTVLYYRTVSDPERCTVISKSGNPDTYTDGDTVKFFSKNESLSYPFIVEALFAATPAAGKCGADPNNYWNQYVTEVQTSETNNAAIEAERAGHAAAVAALDDEIEDLEAQIATVTAARDTALSEKAAVQATLATRTAERDTALSDKAAVQATLDTRTTERNTALSQKAAVQSQLDTANTSIGTLNATLTTRTAERDAALAGKTQAENEREALRTERNTAQAEREQLRAERNAAQALLASAQAEAGQLPTSYVESVWTWDGQIASVGTTTAHWQAGKLSVLQHDPNTNYGPGLTVQTIDGIPTLICRVGPNQIPVNSATHHRAEVVLSANGSPGDITENAITLQECEFFMVSPFPQQVTNLPNKWRVFPMQIHQDLDLGNGGPPEAFENHGDRFRYRVWNGMFDKAPNISADIWNALYGPGKTGDGGVVWTSGLNALSRGTWVKLGHKVKHSLDPRRGWVEVYLNNVLVGGRFYIATMDFDTDNGTFRAVRNQPKWGLYMGSAVEETYLRLRRLKMTIWRPQFAAQPLLSA